MIVVIFPQKFSLGLRSHIPLLTPKIYFIQPRLWLVNFKISKASIQEIEEIFKNNESTLYVLFMASYPKDFCENYLGNVQNSRLKLSSQLIMNQKSLFSRKFNRLACWDWLLCEISRSYSSFIRRFYFWSWFILPTRTGNVKIIFENGRSKVKLVLYR